MKTEKTDKKKPTKFSIPLDATDEELQKLIDALKEFAKNGEHKKDPRTALRRVNEKPPESNS